MKKRPKRKKILPKSERTVMDRDVAIVPKIIRPMQFLRRALER